MSQLARSLRFRSLLVAVVTVLATFLPAGVAEANGGQPARLTVMTRNLYLGSDLTNTAFAPDIQTLVAATTQAWANVLATDFGTRARALAAEVQRARPDVLGLQEVTLWRDETPSDSVTGNPPTLIQNPIVPNARHVVFDFLQILRAALAARGLPYTPVVTSTNADAEAPRLGPQGYVDVRITDRDVIMVRTDLLWRFSNPKHGLYPANIQLSIPSFHGPVTFTRGWTSVDYRYGPNSRLRIFNTHLEVPVPGLAQNLQPQLAQGAAALAILAASPHPVIALGDYNSAADGSGTLTYGLLAASLRDAWTAAHGSDPGLTCCQSELLNNATGQETSRIDLILSSQSWPVDRVDRTGAQPFRSSPPPLWASDHFGVTARFTLN
jgi:endonuclease/exonuclease/phosphatase family metal-dependent hydrolase